jgi:plastocyanin
MKINNASKGLIIVGAASVIALAAIILSLGPTIGNVPATMSQGSFGSLNEPRVASITAPNNAEKRVAVGGGNITVSINQFSPPLIQIQPGQSVNFYAPSGSTELHNVVLDMSGGGAISSIELAYILPSGFSPDTLELAPPDNIGEPIIQNTSDGRQTILALNKVLFHPSAVNQNGDATFLREDELIQQMEQGAQQGLFMPPSLSVDRKSVV